MKKIVTLFSLFTIFYCKAQSPIIPLYTQSTYSGGIITDAYYKDVDSLQNQFVGSWKYTNGPTTFKIVLSKFNTHYNGKYYEDIIVGEYEYYENGVLKISTLSNLLIPQVSRIFNIRGRIIFPGSVGNPLCDDCSDTDRKVIKLDFFDRERDLSADIYLRRADVGTQLALRVTIFPTMIVTVPGDTRTNFDLSVPTFNNIIMLKEN
jgi:hypothetical protein